MALFGRRQAEATVSAMAWSRTVNLELRQWVSKRSSWVPSDDVRNVKRHTEQRWEQVPDSQPNTAGALTIPGASGSAFRTELRPEVYYTYEALEWRRGRTLTASGTGPGDVRWPDDPLAEGERVRSRDESYTVTLTADGKEHQASLPEQEWRALELGAACQLTLGLLGGVKSVTPS